MLEPKLASSEPLGECGKSVWTLLLLPSSWPRALQTMASSSAHPTPLHLEGAVAVLWEELQMEAYAVVKVGETVGA